ncbi:angiotensin-converting enzyme domain-containing protein [Phthorimaea operculella]|nr:angiotensin-converting enzyme domain-containing protein [Phthorimaea operculella]
MKLTTISTIFWLIATSNGQTLNSLFERINDDYLKFNQIAAEIAWESSADPGNPELPDRGANYQRKRIDWQQNVCDKLAALSNGQMLNATQMRQTYLLCRGPKFTFDEAREMSALYEQLQSTYSEAEICIQTSKLPSKTNLAEIETAILNYLSTVKEILPPGSNDSVALAAKFATVDAASSWANKDSFCLKGEEDVEKMMRFSTNERVLKWLWLSWREKVVMPMKEPYKMLVDIENIAAQRNGYHDIGTSWRDELETPNLRQLSRRLYEEIRPLYAMLHAVVRFHLRRLHGDVVPEYGAIPAHLLGNLWSQNWEPLISFITPRAVDLDQKIQALNWTTQHILKRAEDFYQSLGLPPMTDKFWSQSVFAKEKDKTRCHGTAADMFQDGDYRLLYCSGTSAEDMYVIHHEMGHIHYYMAYAHQPGIFRAAHSALHETIGDTIMYGVLTPQHLHRLGLINDSILFQDDEGSNDDDEISTNNILLLKQALNKLPQIPFALLIDEYRWRYFEGQLDHKTLNQEFWRMARELQGIQPPGVRGEEYFDVGAKFHVPDNTPYIRYFLSSFLQHQLFETLCKAAVFGRRGVVEELPPTIAMNRCDIYGSKAVGKVLKDLMSRGHSQHWHQILSATTGSDVISASALKRYYRPLYTLLERMIQKHRIPVGW